MRHYMVLSRLTDEGRKTVANFPERIRHVNRTVENIGAKVIAQYALLGAYDFVTIVQAEDDQTILKAALELGARGTMQTTSVPAIPIDEFIESIKK